MSPKWLKNFQNEVEFMKYYEAVRPKFQHGFQGEIQPGSVVKEFGETDSLCTKTLGLYEFSSGEWGRG